MMEQVGQQFQQLYLQVQQEVYLDHGNADAQTAALAFGGQNRSCYWSCSMLHQKNGQVQVHKQQLQSQLLNTLLIYLINVERIKK
jgi:hypothetical protein